VDAVLYRLAGIFNQGAGYGVIGDTFGVWEEMRRLGEPDWFRLGDRDLAHCLLRSELLRGGMRMSEACLELGRRLGLSTEVLPMSDQPVRTWFDTDAGGFSFQEYFVRERTGPRVRAIKFEGMGKAQPGPEASAAAESGDLVVIGPSNPLISVAPILALLGERVRPERTLAVSPIVAGRALKGPTVEMMRSLGREASALGVAREYRGRVGWFVLDVRDAELAPAVADLGYRVVVADTVMGEGEGSRRLAAEILKAVSS
jgi:LPPG:FO 2-phospho-L-lactate transferase